MSNCSTLPAGGNEAIVIAVQEKDKPFCYDITLWVIKGRYTDYQVTLHIPEEKAAFEFISAVYYSNQLPEEDVYQFDVKTMVGMSVGFVVEPNAIPLKPSAFFTPAKCVEDGTHWKMQVGERDSAGLYTTMISDLNPQGYNSTIECVYSPFALTKYPPKIGKYTGVVLYAIEEADHVEMLFCYENKHEALGNRGMFYLNAYAFQNKNFKEIIDIIERSNPGFKFGRKNYKGLRGKQIGIVVGEGEYMDSSQKPRKGNHITEWTAVDEEGQ